MQSYCGLKGDKQSPIVVRGTMRTLARHSDFLYFLDFPLPREVGVPSLVFLIYKSSMIQSHLPSLSPKSFSFSNQRLAS